MKQNELFNELNDEKFNASQANTELSSNESNTDQIGVDTSREETETNLINKDKEPNDEIIKVGSINTNVNLAQKHETELSTEQKDMEKNKYDVKFEISKLLMDLPFDSSLVGFGFLMESVMVILELNTFHVNLNRDVYSAVAKKYGVSISQVDKSIRNLIYNASKHSMKDSNIRFPNTIIKTAVYSSRSKFFITAIAEYIKCSRLQSMYRRYELNN